MKLITKELKERFLEIGDQSNDPDPIIIAKFFSPIGAATWFASEYNKERNICHGYVRGLVPGEWNDEWGNFSIDELEAVRLPLGLGIERDLFFNERRFSELPFNAKKVDKEKEEAKNIKATDVTYKNRLKEIEQLKNQERDETDIER